MKPNPSKFIHSDDGAVTVEAALWLPFILFFFIGIGELALIYHGQTRTLEVAQDATRLISIGELMTETESSDYISAQLANFTSNATSTNQVDKGLITTVVSVPASDFAPFGFFTSLANFNVTVVAQQVVEF